LEPLSNYVKLVQRVPVSTSLPRSVFVSADEERTLAVSILAALGAPADEAAIQAEQLVEADLRGHASHGIQRLPLIVDRIRNGVTVPGAQIEVNWQTPTVASIDAGRGLGPVVALRVVELISVRARETGIAVAAVRNNNHLGMLGPYVEALARRGQLGLAMTTSEALVHPFGGRKAMVGTNPLAIAIPADPDAFVLDMATAEVSMGRILAHLNRGEPIPSGWALDEQGAPTTDPEAAARGSISPFGGAKGYGLGLAIELLVGALTGSAVGRAVRGTLDATAVCNKGDLFVCLDPSALGLPEVAASVTPYLREIREDSDGAGTCVTVPGDRCRVRRRERLERGVPIPLGLWDQLKAIRDEVTLGA
jgi:L-2-hydroxycarboxylate dehydrogenase (NAD+)